MSLVTSKLIEHIQRKQNHASTGAGVPRSIRIRSTPEERRVLEFSKAYRIIAIVGWFIERIVALNEGEKVFIEADVEEYWKTFETR
jgi:hypothetical protein